MDVDGTLTDGSMVVQDGEQVKTFHAHDGLGMRLAVVHGLKIAWVTGNQSPAVTQRAKALGIQDVCQNARMKSVAIGELVAKHGLAHDEMAFVGDDLNDLPAFERVGVSFAVANAVDEVKRRADIVTTHSGGRGAIREIVEMLLKARGEWDQAVAGFLAELEREESGKAGPEAVA